MKERGERLNEKEMGMRTKEDQEQDCCCRR